MIYDWLIVYIYLYWEYFLINSDHGFVNTPNTNTVSHKKGITTNHNQMQHAWIHTQFSRACGFRYHSPANVQSVGCQQAIRVSRKRQPLEIQTFLGPPKNTATSRAVEFESTNPLTQCNVLNLQLQASDFCQNFCMFTSFVAIWTCRAWFPIQCQFEFMILGILPPQWARSCNMQFGDATCHVFLGDFWLFSCWKSPTRIYS